MKDTQRVNLSVKAQVMGIYFEKKTTGELVEVSGNCIIRYGEEK